MQFDNESINYLDAIMAYINEGQYDTAREKLQDVPEDIRDEIRMSAALLTGTLL